MEITEKLQKAYQEIETLQKKCIILDNLYIASLEMCEYLKNELMKLK